MRSLYLPMALGLLALTRVALADTPVPPPSPPAPSLAAPAAPLAAPAPSAATPAIAPSGLAVVALSGATDAAWPLAVGVYGNPALHPASLDDATARVLCGEPPSASAPAALRDLADSVAAVHGDDAPSRAVLDAIARRVGVREVVVVHLEGGQPVAQLYLAETGAFDAARYSPDAGGKGWTAATASLARPRGAPSPSPPAPPPHAPALATRPEPPAPPPHHTQTQFWQSGWFWGAIGAAALAGGVYFITRDNTASTVHLEVQVPH